MADQGTPQARRSARTRKTMLDAASKIIARDGVEGLSMRVLAREIDYSPSAVYKHFDSKEDLIDAIRQEGFSWLAQHVRNSVTNEMQPCERLLAMGLAYMDFAEKNPVHYPLMLNVYPPTPMSIKRIRGEQTFSQLLQTIHQGLDIGEFVLVDNQTPVGMAYHCFVTLHGISMLMLSILSGLREEFAGTNLAIWQSVVYSYSTG